MSKRILLIHTGGTIGMQASAQGLVPAPGVVETAARSLVPQGVDLEIVAFDPLLDSANIDHRHWNQMLDHIDAWQGHGVVITHGTDTMAHTGAALSQAVAPSARVILCGAMKPLGMQGDAQDNLALALHAAASDTPGVRLAMHGQLLPAARLAKTHASAMHAFRSLGHFASTAPHSRRFKSVRTAIITVSPGMHAPALKAMLGELDAAVLRLYGAGTCSDDPALAEALRAARARGVRLRAVSQCLEGGLAQGAYAAGAGLWALGVEDGQDETPEAALIKVWLDLSE